MSIYDYSGHDYYTIGIKYGLLPWFRLFHVKHHFWSDDELRVTLILKDGAALCFPKMDRRIIKVYPDYRTFKTAHESDASNDEAPEETLQ